ncbi:MAG: hypothetical protein WA770_07045 [Pseudolabrys sp.]|jgi:hypothetical protein
MSDDPKLNEWNLLREKFDAVVDEGARQDNLEQVLDEHIRRRFGELIAWAAGHEAKGHHGPWPPAHIAPIGSRPTNVFRNIS